MVLSSQEVMMVVLVVLVDRSRNPRRMALSSQKELLGMVVMGERCKEEMELGEGFAVHF